MNRKFLIAAGLSFYTLSVHAQQKGINDNISKEDWAIIHSKAVASYSRLKELKNDEAVTRNGAQAAHVMFGWPLRANGGYDEIPNYYYLQNYVDDNNGASIVDYNCNSRSYNGHNGIDICIWPFWWHMMDNDYVHVVAAAPGIVLQSIDTNNNDDNCACVGNGNNIAILHADSSVSIYYHIKDHSALVNKDDVVTQGQSIALVGSSGCSSNPHLHFEVQDKDGNLIDPYVGAIPALDCNNRNEDSWWQNQKPYREPQINRISTHWHSTYTGFCREDEAPYFQNNFSPGQEVWFNIAMMDYMLNTSVNVVVRNPAGAAVFTVSETNNEENKSAHIFPFIMTLPSNAPSGTYQVAATYQGITYFHYFTVSCISDYILSGTLSGARGYIASNSILSTSMLPDGSKIKMQAAGVILLNPGFTAVAGTTFRARIKDCNYSD